MKTAPQTVTKNIGEQNYTARCMKIGDTLWMHINGRTYLYEPENLRNKKQQNLTEDPSRIVAPMPGRITKLHKKTGDDVIAGEVIVSMEAMKMEYALKSGMAGTLKSLNVKEGQQVTLGEVLASFED